MKGMMDVNEKIKLKEIYTEDFGQQWTKMKGRPSAAKDINMRRIDEMSTEDSNGDIVKVMRRQMEEMPKQLIEKQMNEMNAMQKQMTEMTNMPKHMMQK